MIESIEVSRRYLNRRQAAAYIGVSERKLDMLVQSGRIPRSKVDCRVLLDVADLDLFMRSCKT